MNPGAPEYEAEMLPNLSWCLMPLFMKYPVLFIDTLLEKLKKYEL